MILISDLEQIVKFYNCWFHPVSLCFGDLIFLVTVVSTDLVGYRELYLFLSVYLFLGWRGIKYFIFIMISWILLNKVKLRGAIYFTGMLAQGSC